MKVIPRLMAFFKDEKSVNQMQVTKPNSLKLPSKYSCLIRGTGDRMTVSQMLHGNIAYNAAQKISKKLKKIWIQIGKTQVQYMPHDD